MQQIDQLLEKFWNTQITTPELQQLYYLLSIHKENLSNQVSWNVDTLEKEVARLLTNRKSHELLIAIHTTIKTKKPAQKYLHLKKRIYPILAAASITGILLISIQWFSSKKNRFVQTAATKTKPVSIKYITNTQHENKQVVLPDGSTITLQPGAAITYYQHFINNRRDISLTGNALFKVVKDKNNPFSVFAKGLSTTALGTQFWVYASDKNNYHVDLLEGRVLIRVTDNSFSMNDVYLRAGQRFNINLSNKNFIVSGTSPKSKHAAIDSVTNETGIVLSFKDEPIENVLEKIKTKFQQPIVFNKQDMRGLTFTGNFLVTDDVHTILSVVCNMNDLVFANTNDTIIINKKP